MSRFLYDGQDALLAKLQRRDFGAFRSERLNSPMTLSSDGRKGINGESNEAVYALSGSRSVLLTTVDFGSTSKTAAAYEDFFWEQIEVLAEQLNKNPYEAVFALVTDRGGACLKGRQALEETKAIASVSCKAHETALLAKKLVLEVDYLNENVAHMNNVVYLFTMYSVAAGLLREAAGGAVLPRLCETRFLFMVLTALRVKKHHAKLNGICQAFGNGSLKEWITTQDEDHKSRFARAKQWLQHEETLVFLNFFIDVCSPLVLITREMDRSTNNLYILHGMWSNLTDTLGAVFGKSAYAEVKLEVKKHIASYVMDFWRDYSEPYDTASYMFAPQNFAKMGKLKAEDAEEFDTLASDSKHCIRVFLRSRDVDGKTRPQVLNYDHEDVDVGLEKIWGEYLSAIQQDDSWNPEQRNSLGFALRSRLRAEPHQDPVIIYRDVLMGHKTSLHAFGVAVTSIVPTSSATERGHKDERDTRTPARSSTTRVHADKLIRGKQSLRAGGGLRTVEEMAGLGREAPQLPGATTTKKQLAPFEVLEKFSVLCGDQEDALAAYVSACERAEQAVATNVARARHERDGADVGDVEPSADDVRQAVQLLTVSPHDDELAEPVGDSADTASTRPRRRAAAALRAYVTEAVAQGRL